MTESTRENGDVSRATALTLCILTVAIGAILRVAAMRGDLSFDEVWSIIWARWVGSPIEIFTAIHIDNNHYLNTLSMWLLLPLDWHAAWRLPAVIASVATIGLAALYGARHSRAAAISCAVLHAFSFLLIQYGSEARGYALAACMVVAAMIVIEQEGDASPARLLLFSGIVGIGILAHLTVLLFALPASALLFARAFKQRPDASSMIIRLAALGAVPVVITGSLWWFDLRFLHIAGGPESSVATAMIQLAGLVVGIWRGTFLGTASLGACALFALLAIPKVRAGQGPLLLIAASTLLLSLALVPGNMAYPRYFLVPFELLLLSLGRSLGVLFARSYLRVGVICLAIVAAANLPAVVDLATIGRGQFRAALSSIAARSQGEVVRVGSDHDLRNGQTFQFYAPRIPEGRRLTYQPRALEAGPAVDWLIFHDTDLDAPAPPDLIEVRGTRYALDHSERHAGMSGFTWHLYRRSAAGRRDAEKPPLARSLSPGTGTPSMFTSSRVVVADREASPQVLKFMYLALIRRCRQESYGTLARWELFQPDGDHLCNCCWKFWNTRTKSFESHHAIAEERGHEFAVLFPPGDDLSDCQIAWLGADSSRTPGS